MNIYSFTLYAGFFHYFAYWRKVNLEIKSLFILFIYFLKIDIGTQWIWIHNSHWKCGYKLWLVNQKITKLWFMKFIHLNIHLLQTFVTNSRNTDRQMLPSKKNNSRKINEIIYYYYYYYYYSNSDEYRWWIQSGEGGGFAILTNTMNIVKRIYYDRMWRIITTIIIISVLNCTD